MTALLNLAAALVAAIILSLLVSDALLALFALLTKAYNRRLRSKNIAAKGWPPPHLDADGDFKTDGVPR